MFQKNYRCAEIYFLLSGSGAMYCQNKRLSVDRLNYGHVDQLASTPKLSLENL